MKLKALDSLVADDNSDFDSRRKLRGIAIQMIRAMIVAAALLFTSEQAFAYCSKPDAPYCATRFDAFDDQDDFDSCKSETESYKSNVEDFMRCLRRQGDEAVSDYESAVASFNRRAGG